MVGQLPPWLCKGRCPWEACLAISALSWGEGRGNRAAGVTLKANEGRAFIPQKRVDGCVREPKRRHVRNGKHNKYFIVEAVIDGIVYGVGKGGSKKEAEQNASKEAINKSAR